MPITSSTTNAAEVKWTTCRANHPVCRTSPNHKYQRSVQEGLPRPDQHCARTLRHPEYRSGIHAAPASLQYPHLSHEPARHCQTTVGGTSLSNHRLKRNTTRIKRTTSRWLRLHQTGVTTHRPCQRATTTSFSPQRSYPHHQNSHHLSAHRDRDRQLALQQLRRAERAQQATAVRPQRPEANPANNGSVSHTTHKKSTQGEGFPSLERSILRSVAQEFNKQYHRIWRRTNRRTK
jgi:hypothetical protein